MTAYLINVFAFSYRNYIFAKRNVFFLVEMLFWPIMGLISVGLMGDFLKLGDNALAFVLTGAIASGVLQVTQLDVGYSILYDVWSKSVKHTFLAPSNLSSAILGAWLVGIVRGTAVFLALTYISGRIFDFHLPGLLPTVIFLVGLYWTALVLGIFVWVLVLNYGQRAEIAVWATSYLVMVLCGIYYPVDVFPQPFFILARLIPLTYFLDHLRGFYGFPVLFQNGIWTGCALGVLYTMGGLLSVQLALAAARRNGQLLRMSE